MSTQIKICGLSTSETVLAAAEAGASHVGLVHFEPSPRHIGLVAAASLRAQVPANVKAVLLMVNPDEGSVLKAAEQVRPDIIQFHGQESPDFIADMAEQSGCEVWKAIAVRDEASLKASQSYHGAADLLLFDAPAPSTSPLPGGNGEAFDWSVLKGNDHRVPWGLAGGLSPSNVAEAIQATGAPLVDTSSGVESAAGIKDVDKIAAFCKAAREA